MENRITFELILKEYEEYVPTELLRRMWLFTIDLVNQLQTRIDEFELASCNCHTESTRTSEPEC